jgi:hypothetical protein
VHWPGFCTSTSPSFSTRNASKSSSPRLAENTVRLIGRVDHRSPVGCHLTARRFRRQMLWVVDRIAGSAQFPLADAALLSARISACESHRFTAHRDGGALPGLTVT